MVGASIFGVLHPVDISLAKLLLGLNVDESLLHVLEAEIRFTLRFRCALGRRNAGITIGGHKPIHFTGRISKHNDCRFIGNFFFEILI